jgi:hypothetical protein
VQVSTCLFDAYEDYNCFGEVFLSCQIFKMEERAANKFCVKLKKTATETFEMLKCAYDKECLPRTSVSEWHKRYTEPQNVRMQKSRVKTMLTLFFDAKVIIHHEFLPEKQTVNGKFHKELIKRLVSRVHRVRPEFQESGFWYLLHDNAQAYSSGLASSFGRNEGFPCQHIHHIALI